MEIIALLPFFTQKFMYGDDLWGFDNDFNGSIQAGLYFSRPFIGFLQGYVVNSDFLHIHDFPEKPISVWWELWNPRSDRLHPSNSSSDALQSHRQTYRSPPADSDGAHFP